MGGNTNKYIPFFRMDFKKKKISAKKQKKLFLKYLGLKYVSKKKTDQSEPHRHEQLSINYDMDLHSNMPLHSLVSVEAPDAKTIIQSLGLPPEEPLENGDHDLKSSSAVDIVQTHHIRSNEKSPSENNDPNDENKFKCPQCSKLFQFQRLINRHVERCHLKIKRHSCEFCGKGFYDAFDLKRHARTHSGVRPYKCDYCGKSFTQLCSLESHRFKLHKVQQQYAYKEHRTKMYVCEECGHTAKDAEVHYLHLKSQHPHSSDLLRCNDKRCFNYTNPTFANNVLRQL